MPQINIFHFFICPYSFSFSKYNSYNLLFRTALANTLLFFIILPISLLKSTENPFISNFRRDNKFKSNSGTIKQSLINITCRLSSTFVLLYVCRVGRHYARHRRYLGPTGPFVPTFMPTRYYIPVASSQLMDVVNVSILDRGAFCILSSDGHRSSNALTLWSSRAGQSRNMCLTV